MASRWPIKRNFLARKNECFKRVCNVKLIRELAYSGSLLPRKPSKSRGKKCCGCSECSRLMATYRTPVFSQDLDGVMSNNHSRSISSGVLRDVTNTSFPCLCLSEETMTDTLHQGVEAVLLQLSLSQTQMTTDQNLRCEAYSRVDPEELRNMEDYDNRVCTYNSVQPSKNMDAAMDNEEGIIAKEPVSPPASQCPGSTELSLPPAQLSNPIRGGNGLPVDKSDQGKRSGDKSPIVLRDRKKSKNKMVSDEDVEAAIGLTVATAETLVIADIINGCHMCQSVGPKAILDAALSVRRERDALGLNDFILKNLQGTPLADPTWEEDLDDTILEAECYGTLWTDSMEKGPCNNTSRLADVQSSECPVEFEIAMTTVEAYGSVTRSTIEQHPQAQCEESFSEVKRVVQGTITHSMPELQNKMQEGVTSHKCIEAQVVALKDPFNSRWLGGWTGVNCAEVEQACCKGWQLEKRHNNSLKFETSELSETCDSPPPAENLFECFKDFQTKSTKHAVNLVPEPDAEALSTGSCAEILMALSQPSIKCSFQEPLCSFVPCSVNVKINPSSTENPRCNDVDSAEGMTRSHECCIANGLVSCDNDNTSNEPHPMLENASTKRTHLDSLKKYSTISSILQGTLQPTDNHCPKQVQDSRVMLNGNGPDSAVKAAESIVPPNKSVQCELILEDSTLQDSPPLIWHRGKRRRLRACRIAESDLTWGTSSDYLSGLMPLVECAMANFSESENLNIEECDEQRETHKDVPLLSCGNQFSTKYHFSNGKPGLLEEQYYKNGPGQSHMEVLDAVKAKQKVFSRRENAGTSHQIFKGVSFLVTGFSASEKNIFEKLCKKIQEHGGIIMSSIPSFSSLNGQKTLLRQQIRTSHSIVIAPHKVRTLKYLYGCAAGLLIVRPDWLEEMITKKGFLFNHKCKGKETIKQLHVSACSDRERTKDLIFSRIATFVHGQRSYCLKLSLLIQHGAGKVFKSMKSLVQVNNVEGSLIRVVVAEHQSKLSHIIKETAAKSGLPIVSGDWIIDSLLTGRLLALPAVATEAPKPAKVLTSSKATIAKKSSKKRLGIKGAVSFGENILDSAPLPHKEGNMMKPFVSFLGQGEGFPALSSMGRWFVLDTPKTSASGKLSRKNYYKSICMNGIIYTAGDIVEVQPETGEVVEPYVAQIESFYGGHSSSINTRSSKIIPKGEPEKPCFLCCRWFYRPSDTGFPCVGNGRELYLSQHFDDNAPVHSIIKKVQVVLVVGEKTFINDSERGWREPMQNSCMAEAADYSCRFFYDYRKESLHQLKAALTSQYPI